AHAGQLDVAREADAEQAALLAGAQAFLREPIPPGHLQRAPQHRRVIAAVVDDVAEAAIVGQADVVRHVGGLHEVGEADGGAVAAGLAGDQVMTRSSTKTACGWPAPRYGVTGTRWV